MKPKCTKELIAEAVKLKKTGMNNKDMCACLRIVPQTLSRWINHPRTKLEKELGEALKNAEAEFKTALRMRIVSKSQDNWQAAAWMLERMYPEEYAKPEVQLAKKAAEEASEKTLEKMTDVLVKIRETAENAE